MEAGHESLRVIPRRLVVGEVDELFVCGMCDGLLREPRHAGACSEHIFCRVCYGAALSKDPCCPTCKQSVDVSEPLQGCGPFEAMVNSTVVRCPNRTADRGGTEGKISQEPAMSREAIGSSARSLGSVQAPGVEEAVGDGGHFAPQGGGAVGSGLSASPFDGVHVGAPTIIL